jgi:hypothetical protein
MRFAMNDKAINKRAGVQACREVSMPGIVSDGCVLRATFRTVARLPGGKKQRPGGRVAKDNGRDTETLRQTKMT